jgi:tRNA-dihydrouridine synthase B
MEDVSDPPFRQVCKTLGADLLYTEFISSEGLIRDAAKSKQKLDIFPEERPIGIQLFGGDTDVMVEAARIAAAAQPDFIDINFGCPVKKVVCKGAGAAILKDLPKMVAMTKQVVQSVHLPVTVKTRLGWDADSINILEVALRLQDAGIQALTIHGRTRAQLYKGNADWTYIQQVKAHPDIEIPIFGNGDVYSPSIAHHHRIQYGVDGIMIGRAAIGYPWIFREIKHYFETGTLLPPPTLSDRVAVCKQHLTNSLAWNYFKGIHGIKPYRAQMVAGNTAEEIVDVLDYLLAHEAEFANELEAHAPLVESNFPDA